MSASEHRARARAALQGNWPWAVLTSLVAVLTGAIASSGGTFEIKLSETETLSLNHLPDSVQTMLVTVLGYSLAAGMAAAALVTIVQLILGGVAGIGYRKYLLNLIDGEEAAFEQMFSQFHRLWQALLVRFLRGCITTLPLSVVSVATGLATFGNGPWLLALGLFLLLIVLCIVAIYVDYGLAMSEFCMADDENCTAVEALKRSWKMMKGLRLDLFFLSLSFIGWMILSAFTFGIGGLFLTPYMQVAEASFYRSLKPKTAGGQLHEGYTDYAGVNHEYL